MPSKPTGLKRVKKPQPTDFERWSLRIVREIWEELGGIEGKESQAIAARIVRQRVRERYLMCQEEVSK
jgi:hypothetical protein